MFARHGDGRSAALVPEISRFLGIVIGMFFREHGVPQSLQALGWTSDGRDVLFTGAVGDSSPISLWKVAREGGEPRRIGAAANSLGLWGFGVHPDGRQVAFTAGPDARSEVWVMEHLLPPLAAGK